MPKYRIMGAYEETGSAVTLEVEAADEGKAALIAERRRVLVSRIETADEAPAIAETSRPELRQPWFSITQPDPTYVWPKPGFIRRRVGVERVDVPVSEVQLSDLVRVRQGRAYFRVDQRDMFWTFVWGFVVGNVMLWLLMAALGMMMMGGVFGALIGAAAKAAGD